MKLRRSIHVSAGAHRVWPLLVQPDKILQWCAPIGTIRYSGAQRSGVGTGFYFEERAAGRLLKLELVVTEWVKEHRVAFKMRSGNFVKSYSQTYTIGPAPSGILVTIHEEVKLPYGLFGKIAGVLRKPTSNGHLDRMLLSIKRLAEQPA